MPNFFVCESPSRRQRDLWVSEGNSVGYSVASGRVLLPTESERDTNGRDLIVSLPVSRIIEPLIALS